MPKIDMSPQAVSTRLRRVAQLRRLGLSLQKSKLPAVIQRTARKDTDRELSSKSDRVAAKE